ncbi:MAG: MATE family efflux transporter [Lachnospiraceae bacterium]|jgi:putative MATE family efflux protein|nr:MATE family efflux transporter [Lachnospiraceae bacterium]MDD3616518.1 MATE family efflux transporter [Lachnospiraceae bacterium]
MSGVQIDKKQFYKTVAGLVIPMALQNLINVGVTSADVIMLGKVGETALSASSLAGQVYFVMTLIFFGLTSGAAVLTAQYWGKRDTRTIEKIMGMALRMGIVVALIFMAAVWLIPTQLMHLFTREEAVVAEGVRYLRIISFSYILSAITMVYLNIVRSIEKVMIATITYACSLAVNVILNAVFIFGLFGCPAMGIAGAALGTLIARVVELIIVVVYDCKYNDTIRFKLSDLVTHDKLLLEDFIKISLPVVLNELAWGLGMAVMTSIMGHLGQAAVAANSVTQVSRQLAMVVSFGVAGATAIMIGKSIGEGREDVAKEYGRLFTKMSVVLGLCGAVVILCISPVARHFLTLSQEAKGYLRIMMFVMSYYCVAQSINSTWVVGIFRGGGDTKAGLIIDLVFMWGFSILLGFVAAFVLDLPVTVVYFILVSDELVKMPFVYKRYRSYKWLRNVTR